MVTQKDVAKLAGVSFMTVSRVINNKGTVKDETREKVLEAIKELDYHPNSFARGLNTNQINTIGVVFNFGQEVEIFDNPYYHSLLRGIEKISKKNNYDLLISLASSENVNMKYLRTYKERKVDGLILINPDIKSIDLKKLSEKNIPSVIVARTPTEDLAFVDSDNHRGGYEAVKFMIKKGHRKIAYIRGFDITSNCIDRYKGFKRALKDNGIKINKDWISTTKFIPEKAIKNFKDLLSMENRPTVVFFDSDDMAIAVMREAKKMGVNIPEDISIMGFDGMAAGELLHPRLSTMKQPITEMGSYATEILIERMSGSKKVESKIFDIELIEGGTVKQI